MVPPGSPVVNCMVRNPAEHCVGQAANQSRLTCGFVLFPSSANAPKTQDLFSPAKITAKSRFPTVPRPQTSVEFLPPDGKIFTIATTSAVTFASLIAAAETKRV